MAIGHWEKVAVLQPAEVWHRNPRVLVHLFGVAGWNSSFGRKRKLSHCIGVHLLWIGTVVTEWGQICRVYRLLLLTLRLISRVLLLLRTVLLTISLLLASSLALVPTTNSLCLVSSLFGMVMHHYDLIGQGDRRIWSLRFQSSTWRSQWLLGFRAFGHLASLLVIEVLLVIYVIYLWKFICSSNTIEVRLWSLLWWSHTWMGHRHMVWIFWAYISQSWIILFMFLTLLTPLPSEALWVDLLSLLLSWFVWVEILNLLRILIQLIKCIPIILCLMWARLLRHVIGILLLVILLLMIVH